MAQRFQHIGLIGKYADPTVGATLHAVAEYLKSRTEEILLDEATAEVWPEHGLETVSREEIGRRCDLVVVVGGDGTLLNAARSLAAWDTALVGINLGRLGFLTDITPDQMQATMGEILAGRYIEDHRFLLHCTILRDGEQISESDALNDVVIHKWDVARMIEVSSYVNGKFVNNSRADGLIISTPTGSTAYALSGGGPILHPSLNAMVLVPICPHTMSNRPLVIDGESRVEIIVRGREQDRAQVTCDGQINLGLVTGDHIVIEKRSPPVCLVHPVNHDHFHILREKLNWG